NTIRSSQEFYKDIPVLSLSSQDMANPEVLLAKLNEEASKLYAQLPILDAMAIERIRMFDDEEQSLVRSLFDIYSTDTAGEVHQLGLLIEESNLEDARKKAHKLKSSAAQLGAMRFERYCNLMEYDPA